MAACSIRISTAVWNRRSANTACRVRNTTSWIERAGPHVEALKDDYRNNRLALLRIAEEVSDIAEAEAALARLSVGANTLVFYGTGGSGLGGQTLAQIAGWKIPGVAR